MIKIIMVVPFENMKALAQATFEEILENDRRTGSTAVQYDFQILRAATSDEVLSLQLDADVIIVRGATAYDLQRSNYHIPVVELSISGSDIVSSLLQLREEFGYRPAGIVGSPNMLLGLEDLAKHLDVDVTPYLLSKNNIQEIHWQIDRALADGKQVIMGGERGCDYARSQGAQCLQIQSDKHSIANAILMAMQIGIISRQNQQVALSNQALLDNAFEGLLSLDAENRIRAYNRSAQEILGMPAGTWCLGVNIRDALHSSKIAAFAANAVPFSEEIIAYNNTQISFKKVAVSLRGEMVGSVITFLNDSQILESEEKLRDKLYAKSHEAKYQFSSIIGRSPLLRKSIEIAHAYAQTESNIMLYGETGTGKELFSQSIHNASARRAHPFVAVNCSAIPESLLESELFGYVAGAFTGASKAGKEGLFEQAHTGTVFLDEISEMPLPQQARLLRVLQEREITRLGSNKVTPIDVRVIAATNKDLKKLVREGVFREDLYYRLCVLTIYIPPLRERKEDVALLSRYFIGQFSSNGQQGSVAITPEALEALTEKSWPGNVRELRNFCERLTVLVPTQIIDVDLVQQLFSQEAPVPVADEKMPSVNVDAAVLLEALEQCGGNRTQAAEALGISRVTLWRRMRETGIVR